MAAREVSSRRYLDSVRKADAIERSAKLAKQKHQRGTEDGSDEGEPDAKLGIKETPSPAQTKATTLSATLTSLTEKRAKTPSKSDKEQAKQPSSSHTALESPSRSKEKTVASLPARPIASPGYQFVIPLLLKSPGSKPTKSEKENLQTVNGGAEREKLPKVDKGEPKPSAQGENGSRGRTQPSTPKLTPPKSVPSADRRPRLLPAPPPPKQPKPLLRQPPRRSLKIQKAMGHEEAKPRVVFAGKEKQSKSADAEPFFVAVLDRDRAAGAPTDAAVEPGSTGSSSELKSLSARADVVNTGHYERFGDSPKGNLTKRGIPSSEAPPLADVSDKSDMVFSTYAKRETRSKKRRRRRRRAKRFRKCFQKRAIMGQKGSRKRRRFYIIGTIVVAAVVLVSVCIGLGVVALNQQRK